MSKIAASCTALAFSLFLAGCATPLFHKAPPVGTPVADVTATLGKPDATYPTPDGGQMLEYRGQPMGQFQHMAHIGADGRLVSYEQVLSNAQFAQIGAGRWNKDDILRRFGRPAESMKARATDTFPNDAEVWSYRYKDDGVWNSMMNVYFNARGVVVRTAKSPDPILDERFKGY
jgi:hypothetical protein